MKIRRTKLRLAPTRRTIMEWQEDEITTEAFHDMGKLTLESIPKRYKLYELLVKDHPTSKGKNASTSERLATINVRR